MKDFLMNKATLLLWGPIILGISVVGVASAYSEYMGQASTSYEFKYVQGIHSTLYYYDERVCLKTEYDEGVLTFTSPNGAPPILLACVDRDLEKEQ